MSLTSIAAKVLSPILGIVDKAVVDKDLKKQLQHEIQVQGISLITAELHAQQNIIVAEATGHSWLQRNWRPLGMLFLLTCVGAHWFGFTPENLTPEESIELLELVKVGFGGYVVGRSAEKIATVWKGKGE